MTILGIESSCDETAAAVVSDGRELLSNVIESQIDLHAVYGGVVPEIASRSHLEAVVPVVKDAMQQADTDWSDIDAIAVTNGPGLSGSLLIGTMTARTLAWLHNKPLYGVNHVLAHVYANFLHQRQPQFPMLALIVSGGHTQLVLFKNHFDYELLGQTRDDAVGEAFDKVAKMLGLAYPGGPSVAAAAIDGKTDSFKLPKLNQNKLDKYSFSFSGLKTAVLRALQSHIGEDYNFPSHRLSERLSERDKANMAASFQETAVSHLVDKLQAAEVEFSPASIVIAGGVAANQRLRELITERVATSVDYVPAQLCTDNAAMVAALAYYQSLHIAVSYTHLTLPTIYSV